MHRRKFLVGLGSLLAAPAIVHAGNLMPVKAIKPSLTEDELYAYLHQEIALGYSITRQAIIANLYSGLAANFSTPTFYGKGLPELLASE